VPAKAGDVCETKQLSGTIEAESITGTTTLECPGLAFGSCSATKGGFPNGACAAGCNTMNPGTQPDAETICAVAPPSGPDPAAKGHPTYTKSFDECIRSNVPFERCMTQGVPVEYLTKVLRASCDRTHACRDDYACTSVPTVAELAGKPSTGEASVGQCMPPYFLFQARVDGHN
jgi:hypothetical protein